MKNKPKMTYTIYVNDVKVDKLTEEHIQKISQQMSEAMSIYYSKPEHYEEFLRL